VVHFIPLHEISYEFVVTTSVVYGTEEATQVATTNTGRNSVERYSPSPSKDIPENTPPHLGFKA
jgi:hypothetical protein